MIIAPSLFILPHTVNSHLVKHSDLRDLRFFDFEVKQEYYLFGNQSECSQRCSFHSTHTLLRNTHIHTRTHINTAFQLPGVLRRLAAEGSTTPPTPKHASEQRAHEHRHPQGHMHDEVEDTHAHTLLGITY